MFFRVRSVLVSIDGRRLLLLFLQDISEEKERASLEGVFLHDLNNLVFGLHSRTELPARGIGGDVDVRLVLRTDRPLLLRVLGNMVVNALEAPPEGGAVGFTSSREDGTRFRLTLPVRPAP